MFCQCSPFFSLFFYFPQYPPTNICGSGRRLWGSGGLENAKRHGGLHLSCRDRETTSPWLSCFRCLLVARLKTAPCYCTWRPICAHTGHWVGAHRSSACTAARQSSGALQEARRDSTLRRIASVTPVISEGPVDLARIFHVTSTAPRFLVVFELGELVPELHGGDLCVGKLEQSVQILSRGFINLLVGA